MPELPEVETVRRTLAAEIPGRRIEQVEVFLPKVARPGPEELAEGLKGKRFRLPGRRGKYLILPLEPGGVLVVHLRMTGKLVVTPPGEPVVKHTHAVLHLAGEGRDEQLQLRYIDQRQFGYLQYCGVRPDGQLDGQSDGQSDGQPDVYADDDQSKGQGEYPEAVRDALPQLGPEPLTGAFTQVWFAEALGSKRGKIKPVLLDQGFLAGLGNIYVDEALFRARIHPEIPACALGADEVERLHAAIRAVLEEGIHAGGTSVISYVDGLGRRGRYQEELRVYKREGQSCLACGTSLRRIKVGGRSSFYCPSCQEQPQASPASPSSMSNSSSGKRSLTRGKDR